MGSSSSSLLPPSLAFAFFLVSFLVLGPFASSRSPLASDAVTPPSEASDSLSVGDPWSEDDASKSSSGTQR